MLKKLWSKRPLLLLIILSLVLVGLSFRQLKRGPFRKEKIKVEEVSLSGEESLVSASGKIKAKREANLTFPTSGMLVWVGIQEGDQVKKWQAIASLDKRELEKKLTHYLNLFMTNRWDFEQFQDGYKDEKENYLLTDSMKRILEKAQFSLNNAVIDVEIADLALKLATISTPIEGIVTKVEPSNPGVNITPLNSSFTVVDPSSVYFAASVDESDIGKVKIGQEAKITLDSYDEEFWGKVERIDFVSSTTAGGGTAFQVAISLPENKEFKFKVGMNGDADILLK